jgi:hypothetical protein
LDTVARALSGFPRFLLNLLFPILNLSMQPIVIRDAAQKKVALPVVKGILIYVMNDLVLVLARELVQLSGDA